MLKTAVPSLACICLAIVVLDGCVGLSRNYPEKHSYALEVVRQSQPFTPTLGTVLKIRRFHASPDVGFKNLVYRLSDARYEADFYNEWFVTPNVMLTQQVLNWLTEARLFEYVMDSSGPLSATHILGGTVTALYGDYRTTPPKAVLGLQLFVVHETSSHSDIVLQREYRKEVEVAETTPEALVNGWNAAIRLILSTLDDEVAGMLQRTLLR